MKKKVIIAGKAHSCLIKGLEDKGYEVIYDPTMSYENLEASINQAVGLVVTTRTKLDKNLLQKAECLEWIGRLGSGLEMIDTAFAAEKNIRVLNTPEGNSTAVAEHCVGMILSLLKNITAGHLDLKAGQWARETNRGTELSGKTVGIIGYGHTGSKLAKMLEVFDVNVLAYDKYKTGFSNHYITETTLQNIQEKADIISLHLPLTEETTYLINTAFFDALRKKPYLINTSRGKIIDTEALIVAFANQKISGAALDVLENEKLETYSDKEKKALTTLLKEKKIILTPHIAGITEEAFYKISYFLLDKI